MGAITLQARAELRARWRAWVAIGVLIGIAGAVALAAAVGARRTTTVFDRLSAATLAHHVMVQPNEDEGVRYLEQIAALPEVESVGQMAMIPADTARPAGEQFGWSVNMAATVDGNVGRKLDRPRILAGRMMDYAKPHEAVVSADFVRLRGVGVGDRFPIQTVTFDELFQLFAGVYPKPTGPKITLDIVGVVQLTEDVGFTDTNKGLVYLTPAFYERYAERIATLEVMFVRLKGGDAAVPSFIADARRLAGGDQVMGFEARDQLNKQVDAALGVQATALWVFSAIVALGAVLLAGQALSRAVGNAAADGEVLRALGATRGTRVAALLGPVSLCALIAVLVATAGGYFASAATPIGSSRILEPSPGARFDGPVFATGALVLLVSLLLRGLVAALWAGRIASADGARPALIPDVLARSGMSPAVVNGVRFALEPGRGRTAVPVRSVTAGVVAGVLAIAAALTFDASFERLLDEPSTYGWMWDAVAFGGEDPAVVAEGTKRLADSEHVAAFSRATVQQASFRGGDLQVLAVEPVKGSVLPRMLEGSYPDGAREVALGGRTMREANVRIGQTVVFPGSAEQCGGTEGCLLPFEVVARALFWSEDGQPGDGAIFTPEGMKALVHSDGFSDHLVRLAAGSTVDELVADISEVEGDVGAPRVPPDVQNLGRARGINRILALVLAGLALATTAMALATSVRRKARDLATLKVLGSSRGQIRRTVAWQSTCLVSLGLVVGVPVGIALGRWAWRSVAEGLSVANEPVVPVAILAAGAVVLLILANLIAAVPARTAARTKPAVVLRTE